MSQHLTRREIKHDELSNVVGRTVDYATSHSQAIFKIVGGVAAAIALAGLVTYFLSHRKNASQAALGKAMLIASAPIDAQNPKPEDPNAPSFRDAASRDAKAKALFEEVRAQYGGTLAGKLADVYLGRMAAEKGDLATARTAWQAFIDAYPKDVISGALRFNLVQLDVKDGKTEDAEKALQRLLDQPEKVMPEDAILFELAKVREKMGKSNEALTAYQRIADEFTGSPYQLEAQQKASQLAAGGRSAGSLQ